jgi:hypothetical protein
MKETEALDIEVPSRLLAIADEVIEYAASPMTACDLQ